MNVGDDETANDIVVTSGSEGGRTTFLMWRSNNSYVKGWVLQPSSASIVVGDPTQVKVNATNTDIWVVMVTGTGTAPVGTISGSGMSTSLQVGSGTVRFDSLSNRILIQ